MDYRLSIDRGNLLRGLALFKKVARRTRKADRAVFGFDGSYLSVDAGEQVSLSASG